MLRRLGIARGASLLAVLVLAVVGAFGYAQTGIGQAQLAALVARQLSGPGAAGRGGTA